MKLLSCSDSHQTMLFSHIAPVFPNRILPGNTSKMASWLTFDTKEVLSHQNSKASSSHQTPFHQFPTCLLASKLAISNLCVIPPLVHPATKIFSRSQVPHGVGKGVDEKTAATGVARSFVLHGSHGQLLRMMCSYVFLSQKNKWIWTL